MNLQKKLHLQESQLIEISLQPHQDSQVSLRRSANHVGDEAFVSGGVQDGEMFLLGLKVSSPNLHRFPLVSLLLVCVQSPRQVPTPSKSYCTSTKTFNEHLQLTTRWRQRSKVINICASTDLRIKGLQHVLTMSPCFSLSLLFHISPGFACPPFQLGT